MTRLLQTIYTYRAQWNAYLAATLDDDDAAPDLSKPTLKQLEQWAAPASDLCEVSEAARLALEFYEIGDSEVIPAMLRAILGHFDARLRSTPAPALSPIMVLFEEWDRLRAANNDITDEEASAVVAAQVDKLMLRIMALPATDARDMAAKFSAYTFYGEHNEIGGDTWGAGSGFIRECAAMVGRPEALGGAS